MSWTVTGRNITFGMFGPADGWLGIGFSETPSFQSISDVYIAGPGGFFIDGFFGVFRIIPIRDSETNAVLLEREVDSAKNIAYVKFSRLLVTSDGADEDLDRPLYLFFSFGPFYPSLNFSSPIGDPGNNTWISTSPLQFDCAINPCLCVNGGLCDSYSNTCVCPPGYSGPYCEQPLSCPCNPSCLLYTSPSPRDS